MATYAIGDIQGCYPELNRLLEKLAYDPANDQLWFCGDLVNRGGESLKTLRFIRSLGENIIITLGNHDLSLLAIHERDEASKKRVNPELQEVLFADDAESLMVWLRQQKLVHYDKHLDWLMVHAGLAPHWTLAQALSAANAVERELQGSGRRRLLAQLFGDHPSYWSHRLRGVERLRASINMLTRMRYVDTRAHIQFEPKGKPGTQKAGLYPWFEMPGARARETRVVFGHWSALDLYAGLGVYCLDTGCVWGGKLTAMRLDAHMPEYIQVNAEPYREPPKDIKPRRQAKHKPRSKRYPRKAR